VRRITLNLDCFAVVHGDQDAASIRTIVRTGGMDDLRHDVLIIRKAVGR
jgi:hypothetical protein